MGIYQQWQQRLEQTGKAAPGAKLSDIAGPNASTWRDELPATAPMGATDAEYTALEERLFSLVASLNEIDSAWNALAERQMRQPQRHTGPMAAKLARGEALTEADLAPALEDSGIEREASTLIAQATAARQAIAHLAAQMRVSAERRGKDWQRAQERRWVKVAEAARQVQVLANRAAADAMAAHACYLWTQQLPQSVTRGLRRSVTDGVWQDAPRAPEAPVVGRPDHVDANGAYYVVNQGGAIHSLDATHFEKAMAYGSDQPNLRPATPHEISGYWRRQGYAYDEQTGEVSRQPKPELALLSAGTPMPQEAQEAARPSRRKRAQTRGGKTHEE